MRWLCEKCRRSVNVGLTECPYCAKDSPAAPANEEPGLGLRLLWAAVGLALAAAAVVALFLVYRAFIQPG